MRTPVGEEATLGIPGTYRGALVTHFVHPQTGLHVIRDVQDALVSGWRLTPTQLAHVLTRGSLSATSNSVAEGRIMRSKSVKIEFTSDAALVLYDWLTRFNQRAETDCVDQVEERVLFDLEALLEKVLVAPLQSDYAALLAQARLHVRDECA